ncbi:Crp/Fnr family transcriptional regulator [Candidatus Formimonas warabiya]|uniref:CarD family transcriptional regulator n=1 Tax=Formimonas warabiya TaxID=1761012 RepID=A0A3G1KZA5_FORW1|nr:Crp/Fnr family transcriptional regulator [Candidatus Formimonas warabiya]ATW27740.1 CarD family transcriptional regulator [Candidatus Formimonas warabiya]
MYRPKCMMDLEIFSGLNREEKERVCHLTRKNVYEKNEFVFLEGETADAIYVIKYGKVKLLKVSENGREVILDILKEDDIFGENTFFDDAVHTISAQALEKTVVCSCYKDDFSVLLQNPKTSLKIIQLLSSKINNYTEQVASNAFQDVKGRIAATLLRLAKTYGQSNGIRTTIDIDLTHQDLANLVNASRVMVTNVLLDLRQSSLVTTEGHKIILLDQNKLAEAARAI